MEMIYLCQPSKRWTFEQPKLKGWVESQCKGRTLNLFAGKTKLDIDDECRVDVSDEFAPHYCIDAYRFVTNCIKYNVKFDTIILDPPYSLRKAMEKYNGKYISSLTKIKNKLSRILRCGGLIITLGYDTVGMSKSRGFEKVVVCVICHGGAHHDTLCVVEEKVEELI